MTAFFKRWRSNNLAPATPGFSLIRLMRDNPALATHYAWGTNAVPPGAPPWYLHLGCGERVLDGFINLDFIPHDGRVFAWNLLDVWPPAWDGVVAGIFSEDVLEHFFFAEQVYILCNSNRALAPHATARALMPSLPRLIEYSTGYVPVPGEILHQQFGVETGADALNMGMRFSGHRWLHSVDSLTRMAAMCGFALTSTPCAQSAVDKLSGINLRSETDSLSFASDLCKVRAIKRVSVAPLSVSGADLVEDIAADARLYVATKERPQVTYTLPAPVRAEAFACLNLRSSNLSSFFEHNLKWLALDDARRDNPWYFDETMKSRPCMNIVTANVLRLLLGAAPSFERLTFSPAAKAGEYFTLGPAEIFTLA
jgi:predicted SAM-dependent methyltransferase